MDLSVEEYIIDAKSQLSCNASDEYKNENITYTYTNEQVDANLDYFIKCLNENMSAYIALLNFYDYLNNEFTL